MRSSPLAARRGITLIEMLIAIAVSLIVLLAVIQVFDQLNTAMNNSKATIEQAGELRNVSQRLQADLNGMTASTLPWTPADAGDGYFEYIEGTGRDSDQSATYWGDRDDILMFTARSKDKPFVGRYAGAVIESELAEIIWWTEALPDQNGNGTTDPDETVIRRRVLLIRPDLTPSGTVVATFLQTNDVSVRAEGGALVANSLTDLTLRENRSGHAAGFPHAFTGIAAIPGADAGIDLVLNKVSAFDVRVYDPLAEVRSGTGAGAALIPGDPGWAAATTPIGQGAYVDLNYLGNNTISYYSGPPNAVSRAPGNATLPANTYSTWPEAYEHDGIDQDGDSLIDEARDGFDTAGGSTAAADDPGETETFPPYPHAISGQKFPGLRGIQVRIRVVEGNTRQVRQATVVADFVPE